MREAAKSVLGAVLGAANPQCRFDRTVLLFAHMRCGSTALSNILCSRPEISGYGEAHIAYRSAGDLGRLVVNQALRRAWKPKARFLFDKILHTRHDAAAPADFFQSRAIFLCRHPDRAVPSIRRLFVSLGKAAFATDAAAAEYYAERVERLAELWRSFPAERRLGLTHEALTADTERCLLRIAGFISLAPALENRYRGHAASTRGGGGDPTTSASLGRIVADRPDGKDTTPPDIDPTLRRRVLDAYTRLVELTGQEETAFASSGRAAAS